MSAAIPLDGLVDVDPSIGLLGDRLVIIVDDDPLPSWEWFIADRATVTSAPPPQRSGTVSA